MDQPRKRQKSVDLTDGKQRLACRCKHCGQLVKLESRPYRDKRRKRKHRIYGAFELTTPPPLE